MGSNIKISQEDVLDHSIPDESADAVVSTFGLKTLRGQCKKLAEEIHRVLKPGGNLSLLEISVPAFTPLRFLYMCYLKYIVPLFGQITTWKP